MARNDCHSFLFIMNVSSLWVFLGYSVWVLFVRTEGLPLEGVDVVLPRYVVFPGLDADINEVSEWSFGFASPFNVLFGPKPYVLGWLGEAPFGPVPVSEEEIEGEGEFDVDDEVEGETEQDPDYDYEKA